MSADNIDLSSGENDDRSQEDIVDRAIAAFDAANAQDPRQYRDRSGEIWPQELYFARRLSEWVRCVEPSPSDALTIAARCQHLQRWTVPRESFPRGRVGYKRWRKHLASYHAQESTAILASLGAPAPLIERVRAINLKIGLSAQGEPGAQASSTDSQKMEDALCLLFLADQLESLVDGVPAEKMRKIISKTWLKMSPKAHALAREIAYRPQDQALIAQALNQSSAAV